MLSVLIPGSCWVWATGAVLPGTAGLTAEADDVDVVAALDVAAAAAAALAAAAAATAAAAFASATEISLIWMKNLKKIKEIEI